MFHIKGLLLLNCNFFPPKCFFQQILVSQVKMIPPDSNSGNNEFVEPSHFKSNRR